NLMVILVVTLHWRMRSITNFCLANLAFADLCVGIFCVYQNIVTYLMDSLYLSLHIHFSWIFGEFMCKMYHFINSLSTTASVLILVVICIERYLAIIHPMTCKQMMTLTRLRVSQFLKFVHSI
ncbi:Neuropeptide Y receptor type 1, partial [Orchesella cincta]